MGPSEPKNFATFFARNFSVLKLKLGNGRMPFKDLVVYYKNVKIVNDDARVVNKVEASHTDDARVVIYEHHMFKVQATGYVFTTLHLIRNLRIGPISWGVRLLGKHSSLLDSFLSYKEIPVL
jgi:hypothetical protein